MIAHLKGTVERVDSEFVVVDVQGIGFQVFMPYGSLIEISEIGKHVTLLTKYIVREDSVALYGFQNTDELTVFEYLLSIQGIGPKAALNVLSTFTPYQLKDIVGREDFHSLTAVPGIGKKTAQRMVIDLSEKLKKFAPLQKDVKGPIKKDLFAEAKEALSGLGFSVNEIEGALRSIRSQEENVNSVQDLIRSAMKIIKDE